MPFRAASSATGTDATGEGTLPSGVQTGDLLLAFVGHSASSATITSPPAGWTLQEPDPNPADFSLWCYSRIYQNGDAAPVFGFSAAGNWTVDIAAYSGMDQAAPVNADIGEILAVANALALGDITPTVNNCLLVGFAMTDATGGARTWTQSGSMTERIDQMNNALHRALADEALSGGSGTPVSRTFTVSGSAQDLGGFLLALAPAASGAVYEESVSINRSAGLSDQNAADMNGPVPLGINRDFSLANQADFVNGLDLNQTKAMLQASSANLVALTDLARMEGLNLAGGMMQEVQLAIARQAILTLNGGMLQESQLQLARNIGVLAAYSVFVETDISLARTITLTPASLAQITAEVSIGEMLEFSAGNLVNMEVDLTLGISKATLNFPGLTFEDAVLLAAQLSIATAGQVPGSTETPESRIAIIHPDGRQILVEARQETVTIEGENRSVVVVPEERKVTVGADSRIFIILLRMI